MARIPDINVHQPSTVPQAESSTAQAISAVGSFLGEGVKATQQKRTEEAITGIGESMSVIQSAVESHQESGTRAFSESGELLTEGLPQELAQQTALARDRAGKRFGRIAAQVSQGVIPQEAAYLEAEAAVRELITQTPGFSSEIRGMARELLGFDPNAYTMRKLFSMDKQSTEKTTFEKWQDEANAMSEALSLAGINMSPDSILALKGQEEISNIQKTVQENRLVSGDIALGDFIRDEILDQDNTQDVLGEIIRLSMTEGGLDDPINLTNSIRQLKLSEASDIQRRAREYRASPSETQRWIKELDAKWEGVESAIEDSDMINFLTRNVDLSNKIAQVWGAETFPTLHAVFTAYPQVAPTLLEEIMNTQDPAQLALKYKEGTPIRSLLESLSGRGIGPEEFKRKLLETSDKISTGEDLTPEDLQLSDFLVDTVSEAAKGKAGSTPEAKDRGNMIQSLADRGALLKSTSRVLRSVRPNEASDVEKNLVKDQFTRHVGKTDEDSLLPGNLVGQIAEEMSQIDPRSIRGGVQITATEDGYPKISVGVEHSGIRREHQTEGMRKLQAYIDGVYQQGWDRELGVDLDTFASDLVNRIDSATEIVMEAGPQGPFGRFLNAIRGISESFRDTEWSMGVSRPGGLNRLIRTPDLSGGPESPQEPSGTEPSVTPSLEEKFPVTQAQSLVGTLVAELPEEIQGVMDPASKFIMEWEDFLGEMKDEGTRGGVEYGSIGFGRDRPKSELPETVTPEQAAAFLMEDMATAAADIEGMVNPEILQRLDNNQMTALMSLMFNVGGPKLRISKAIQALNEGDFNTFVYEAFDEDAGFVHSEGKKLPGLVRRRAAERKLFLGEGP